MPAHSNLHLLTVAWNDPVAARVLRDLAASGRDGGGEDEPPDPPPAIVPAIVPAAPVVVPPALPGLPLPDVPAAVASGYGAWSLVAAGPLFGHRR